MTAGKESMGEQPIFTCKAHVFHIDPKTKRTWMSASTAAVSVSFFYDSSRNLYRIISVEGTKAVINSTITPNMTFTKTSQKFGQWSDIRANTVYGLGFASEQELGKFIEKFQEVKEAIQAQQSQAGTGTKGGVANGNSTAVTPVASATASPLLQSARSAGAGEEHPPPVQMKPDFKTDNKDTMMHQRAHSVSSSIQQSGYATVGRQPRTALASCGAPPPLLEGPASGPLAPPAPASDSGVPAASAMDQQLRYENDRLKLALAQSSANAKKWEVELATLKSNNLRLTAALQESTANVDEWKRQLHVYREEVARAKRQDGGKASDPIEIDQLRTRVAQLEAELAQKNEEIAQIAKNRKSEQEQEAKLAQSQIELALAAHDGQRQVLVALNEQFARQLQDLTSLHHEIHNALQT